MLRCAAPSRVELCRGESGGRLLRRFSFEDCEGGAGSEFRGVQRSALLQALADALPPETISFGCSVGAIQESNQPSASSGFDTAPLQVPPLPIGLSVWVTE